MQTKDKYIVCSKDGEIRFFNKVTDNMKASNLMPSFMGDSVLFIDSLDGGDLLLLTFKEYLLLIPTIKDQKSAFDFMFRKGSKPSLIPLRVGVQNLLRYGI